MLPVHIPNINCEHFEPQTVEKFLQLEQDEETEAFLTNCFEKSDWIFTQLYHAIAKAILTWFMTSTSINGLLRRGSMFVFSSAQFQKLLDIEVDNALETLLDLGAGDGMVTVKMAPFFHRVFVTEVSVTMNWRLKERGFTLLDPFSWELVNADPEAGISCPDRFDVISCLNLLDRCDTPLTLLKRVAGKLKPKTGRLVIGIVLPLNQYVETTSDRNASESLDPPNSPLWEVHFDALLSRILAVADFELVRWTRVPYLCEGDFTQNFFYLNEIVMVLRIRSS
ncbi:unnamed protein product [Calicophoron daubneyi]|uniref:Methyltransferase-like protein 9 n=1 Tax=Calicophoron daubneyi TaxID=300641 RepID=A0AAV2T9E6_CALDB